MKKITLQNEDALIKLIAAYKKNYNNDVHVDYCVEKKRLFSFDDASFYNLAECSEYECKPFFRTWAYLKEEGDCFRSIAETQLGVIITGRNRAKGYYVPHAMLLEGKDIFEVTEIEDLHYEDMTLPSLLALTTGAIQNESVNGLITSGEHRSIKDTKTEIEQQQEKAKKLAADIKDVENYKTAELSVLKKQLDDLMQKEREKLALLKTEMMAKITELKKTVIILEDKIYTIMSYLGETITFKQLRTGRPAPIDTEMVFFQKIRFLDEELPRLYSIYDVEAEYKNLEKVLAVSDFGFEFFCPSERTLTFFRISKTGSKLTVAFREHTTEHDGCDNILVSEDFNHGRAVGFLLRDGENLYIGWTEEDKISIKDEIFATPKTTTIEEDSKEAEAAKRQVDAEYTMRDGIQYHSAMSSRVFAMCILQGILDRGMVSYSRPVTMFKPDPLIVRSYANSYLTNKLFGDMGALVTNLNAFASEDDSILVYKSLSETEHQNHTSSRGRGYANRTHNANVDAGIQKINLIEDGKIYVSAEKDNSFCSSVETGSTANFMIYSDEFIDLTYWNSAWVEYYIISKDTGTFGGGGRGSPDYTYIIRFLNIMKDFLKKREGEEMSLLCAEDHSIAGTKNLLDLLSNWKFISSVRAITSYQAKRFVKYLKTGKLVKAKNLYEKIPHVTKSLSLSVYQQLHNKVGENLVPNDSITRQPDLIFKKKVDVHVHQMVEGKEVVTIEVEERTSNIYQSYTRNVVAWDLSRIDECEYWTPIVLQAKEEAEQKFMAKMQTVGVSLQQVVRQARLKKNTANATRQTNVLDAFFAPDNSVLAASSLRKETLFNTMMGYPRENSKLMEAWDKNLEAIATYVYCFIALPVLDAALAQLEREKIGRAPSLI